MSFIDQYQFESTHSLKTNSLYIPYTLLTDESFILEEPQFEIQEITLQEYPLLPLQIYKTYQTGKQCKDTTFNNSENEQVHDERQHIDLEGTEDVGNSYVCNDDGISKNAEDHGINDGAVRSKEVKGGDLKISVIKSNEEYDSFNKILGEIFPSEAIDGVDDEIPSGFQEKIKPDVCSVEKLKRNSAPSRKQPDPNETTLSSEPVSETEPFLKAENQDITAVKPSKTTDAKTAREINADSSLSVQALTPPSLMGVITKDEAKAADPHVVIRKYREPSDEIAKDESKVADPYAAERKSRQSSGVQVDKIRTCKHDQAKPDQLLSTGTDSCEQKQCPYKVSARNEGGVYKQQGEEEPLGNKRDSVRRSAQFRGVEDAEVEMGTQKLDGTRSLRCDSKGCPNGSDPCGIDEGIVEDFKKDDAALRSSKNFRNREDVAPIKSITIQASPDVSVTGTQYTVEPPQKKTKKRKSRNGKRDKQFVKGERENSKRCSCDECKCKADDNELAKSYETVSSSNSAACDCKYCKLKTPKDTEFNHRKKLQISKKSDGICLCETEIACTCAYKNKPKRRSKSKRKARSETSDSTTEFCPVYDVVKRKFEKSKANQTAINEPEKNFFLNSQPVVTLEDGVQICAVKVNIVDRNRYLEEQRKGKNIFQSLFYTYHSAQVPRMKWSTIWRRKKAKNV